MRQIYFLLIFALIIHDGFAQPRIVQTLNDEWKFIRQRVVGAEAASFDDSKWQTISLPHTWNARDGQDGGNNYYRGVGWYRKQLLIDSKYQSKVIYLKFDAVSIAATVYVNGKQVGEHKGAFGAFCFDITGFVKYGKKNLIAVDVNNAWDAAIPPLRGDFVMFGGMYRDVHLLILDPLSISPLDHASSGVYIKQTDVSKDSARLEITTVIRNASPDVRRPTIRCTIRNPEGKTVTESVTFIPSSSSHNETQTIVLRSPHLWNGRKDPHLYSVSVEVLENDVVKDGIEQAIGLRYFSVDAERGFFLNGEHYPLHGVNRHQDRENKGWAISPDDQREDFRLIEEMGCTALRLAHYQHSREFYDLCDRGGMIVWAELALVDQVDAQPAFLENCKEQMRELIKQNYNNPSIMFWSLFNELLPESNRELYGRIVAELNTLAKQLDPTRLTASATRSGYGGDEFMNTVADVVGYNTYKGWYGDEPEDFAAFADTLHARFSKMKLSISEYGAGAGISQHEIPPKKPIHNAPWHPEEWQAHLHEVHWKAMVTRPYIWGTFVWNMFDFASDFRLEGELPGRNDKGLVTYDRKVKKDAYFWYKANWNAEPMVHIASKRYTPRPSGANEVKVYSNCDSVSLTVNGKALGTQTSFERVFGWKNVPLSKVKDLVIATGFAYGKCVKDSCVWFVTEDPIKK